MRQSQLLILCLLGLYTCATFGHENNDADNAVINITAPNATTVWNIPNKIVLEWNTVKIDTSKSIRFFLVNNEMVVQELGTFKNDGFEEGIELAKNIGSGDRYQVMAIELFPDDKFKIAKRVTPFFSIINKASDERKRQQILANANPRPSKKSKKSKAKKTIPPQKTEVAQSKREETELETVAEKPVKRETFQDRKISYTKELKFDYEDIVINIWDHGRQDGDIVSIYLNGVSVVSNYYLTYRKKEFNVKLDPSKSNDLFLYAHNLGKSPPNTVSIEITDGRKMENIILNSDLQRCEAVMISVR